MAPLMSSRRRRLATAAALIVLLAVPCLPWSRQVTAQPLALEHAVKANYLYKFAPFVEWPAQALPTPASPFLICLIGEDPFGVMIDDAVRGQRLDGHPIQVRRLTAAAAGTACHILFVGRSTQQSPADILRSVAGRPVLTVTDKSRGVSGGMIEFVMRDGRVRFEIDEAAARASDMAISSKLLGLALAVNRR